MKAPAPKISLKLPASMSRGLVDEIGRQFGHYARLMRLDRPIGIWLLLWPTLWALWIAADGKPDPWIFTVFVCGAVIMRSAGCVINDYADRDFDGKVARTRDRPLPAGTIEPMEALVLFAALSMVAIGLVLTLNRTTQLFAIGAALLTVIYPFCKRFLAAPQLVLGAAFAWGIPMAFAAQTGSVPRVAWLMYLTVLVWAVIYDTMYAMADREDDLKLGINSTAILFGQTDVFIISVLQFILVLGLYLIGEVAQLGMWYQLSVLAVACLLLYQFSLIRNRDPEKCLRAFINNRYVGATIFIGIVLAYTFKSPAI